MSPSDTWAQFASVALADRLGKLAEARPDGRLAVALAGGSTPAPVYEALAAHASAPFKWERVDLFLSDERMVPLDHAESNYRNARAHLCDRLVGSGPTLHAVDTNRPADEAAAAYADLIQRHVSSRADGIPVFDMMLLGVGTDGHTASLFPGQETLRELQRLVLAAHHPDTGQPRTTFTVPLLAAARLVVFLVAGTGKAEILNRVYRSDPDSELPAALVAHRSAEVIWMVDEPAAAGILKSRA